MTRIRNRHRARLNRRQRAARIARLEAEAAELRCAVAERDTIIADLRFALERA